MMTRMKELEEENRRLKKMYAEERLKAEIIQEAMSKNQDYVTRWLWFYNPKRPHQANGGRPPSMTTA
jgi:putative transposase